MPQTPFTMEPTANQQEINIQMKDFLKKKWREYEIE
jgi:hypothetical protein